jgi:hypothetical protein
MLATAYRRGSRTDKSLILEELALFNRIWEFDHR